MCKSHFKVQCTEGLLNCVNPLPCVICQILNFQKCSFLSFTFLQSSPWRHVVSLISPSAQACSIACSIPCSTTESDFHPWGNGSYQQDLAMCDILAHGLYCNTFKITELIPHPVINRINKILPFCRGIKKRHVLVTQSLVIRASKWMWLGWRRQENAISFYGVIVAVSRQCSTRLGSSRGWQFMMFQCDWCASENI